MCLWVTIFCLSFYVWKAQASAFSVKSHSCLGSVTGFRSARWSLSLELAQLLALDSFKRVRDLHGLCSRTYSSIKLLLYSLSSPVWVRGTVTVTYGCIISVRSGLWRLICKSMVQVWSIFACFGGSSKGSVVSKQRILHWLAWLET